VRKLENVKTDDSGLVSGDHLPPTGSLTLGWTYSPAHPHFNQMLENDFDETSSSALCDVPLASL